MARARSPLIHNLPIGDQIWQTPPVPTTVRDLLKRLQTDGWAVVRQKGSHRQLQHPTKPNTITLAGAPHKPVPTGTEHGILKDAGLN